MELFPFYEEREAPFMGSNRKTMLIVIVLTMPAITVFVRSPVASSTRRPRVRRALAEPAHLSEGRPHVGRPETDGKKWRSHLRKS